MTFIYREEEERGKEEREKEGEEAGEKKEDVEEGKGKKPSLKLTCARHCAQQSPYTLSSVPHGHSAQ